MTTAIKTWQIIDGKAQAIETSLKLEGKTETQDLESWIVSDPSIIGTDLVIIGINKYSTVYQFKPKAVPNLNLTPVPLRPHNRLISHPTCP